MSVGILTPAGGVGLQIVTKDAWQSDELASRMHAWLPRTDLGWAVRNILPLLPAGAALELLDTIQRSAVIESSLAIKALRRRASRFWGGAAIEDYGIVSRRLVTDAFVAAVVDALDSGVGF